MATERDDALEAAAIAMIEGLGFRPLPHRVELVVAIMRRYGLRGPEPEIRDLSHTLSFPDDEETP